MTTKLNEGDIMEGIFALAVALFLAYGKIEKRKLEQYFKLIEPEQFNSGFGQQLMMYESENLCVHLILNLKARTAAKLFAKKRNGAPLYPTIASIGDLDKKVDQIIDSVNRSSYVRKLKNLAGDPTNEVRFTVLANGCDNEKTGGNVKGDVVIQMDSKGPLSASSIKKKICFSVKSKSATVSNLSVYDSLFRVAKHFGMENSIANFQIIQDLVGRKDLTPEMRQNLDRLVVECFHRLGSELVQGFIANRKPLSIKAITFLEKELFGTDKADIVDITKHGVKEVTKEWVRKLKKTKQLYAMAIPNYIRFVDVDHPNELLFHFRLRLDDPARKKILVEIGKMAYLK